MKFNKQRIGKAILYFMTSMSLCAILYFALWIGHIILTPQ